MAISTASVKELREKTGCGMMDCKKALTESNGDMEKAIDFLREKGLAAATKKSGRIAAEGVAMAYVNETSDVGVVIEVNAETDFVAKNADFQAFVKLCGETVIKSNPADVDALLSIKPEGNSLTVGELLQEKVLTIGENIKIRRFKRFEGIVSAYVHAGGKIGVMVNFDTDKSIVSSELFQTMAKDVAMQVAAVNPLYLDKESVPAETVEHEKKILKEQIVNDGKPESIAEKIVQGRMGKFFKEVCLLEQAFVKDADVSVSKYVSDIASKLGKEIKVVSFVRFEKGEGLEKREDNFADEVAGMIK